MGNYILEKISGNARNGSIQATSIIGSADERKRCRAGDG